MNLSTHSFTKRVPRRVLTLASVCALVVAALCLTPLIKARQSSSPRAIVRHGLTVNGTVEGSLQQLVGEDTTVNGGGVLTGDLLVPGTPSVRQNGHPTFGGTVEGSGSAQPSDYQINLNGNAQLGRLITRTDPATMPTVAAPPTATGTRDVTLSSQGQTAGDFSTVRDLTLNGNVGTVSVPPGTYRHFTVNGGSVISLGVVGTSQPAVYNLDSLTLNGGSRLDVVGPVVLTTADAVTVNGVMGSSANPLWLNLRVASGGVTLTGGGALYAVLTAPSGTVTINGNASLTGGLVCDRLTLNGNALLRLLHVDTTKPTVAVAQPAEGALVNTTNVNVSGTFADESPTTIVVNGVPATIQADSFTASVPLNEGQNTLVIVATDAAGNRTEVTRTVTRDTVAPALTLNSPAAGVIARRLSVSGTATDALPVSVTMNGIELSLAAGGAFDNQFDMPEGTWDVRVVASDAAGNKSELTRSVTIDTTPPVIGELSPPDGEKVDSPATVRGRVTDASPATVKVNNREASVDAAGAFTASGVALNEGNNQVSISAVDAAGNESAATISLVGRDHTPPAAPTLFAVTTPTRLAFQAVEGRAEPGAVVTLTGGAEPATANASFGNGHFVANVKLAAGVNNLSVVAADAESNVSPPAQVSILSDPAAPPPAAGQPAQINISTGNTQKGLVNTELPRPLIAIVTDSTGAPLSGVSVRFTAQEGGGHFVGGGGIFESLTDVRGYASARYVSGAAPGLQQVRSDFPGNMITPAVFLAEAFEAEAGAETLVSGSVLDQNLRALPNVLVRLGGQQTRTGADGIFVLRNVASGPHQLLELIGRDQITLPGRWPNITYDMDVLPGIDNELGRPLFLPKVNEGVAMPLDGQGVLTQDVVVELPVAAGEPPVRVTARAGTHVTFPPDATDKRLSVTRIAAGRVPMALEDGRATNLYISVQPSGALFEPPLEVSFPNLDRQPADSEVLLMSFDHDAGRYVKVGTAHVTADGRSVKSDPGVGIRVGAWHATPPDPPKPLVTVLGQIQLAGNPAFQNKVVTRLDAWVDGVRAVLSPDVSSSPPVVYARVTIALSEGDVHSSAVQAKAQTAQLTVSPTEVFVAVNGEKEVTATLAPSPAAAGTFTWQSDSTNTATVTPDSSNPSVAKIKGVKQGKTKVTVTYVDPNNPKAKLKAEVKVNVGAVTYKKAADCAGFDDTQKDASQNPIPWLVVPTGGNSSAAKADIEPDSAATHVTFSSLAPATATVAPATAAADNQVLTVTGVAKGTTDIEAKFDNTSSDKLKVAVKDKKTVRVSFNFVADTKTSGTGIDHKTNRRGTQAEEDAFADAIIARMNAIWKPQANVVFEKKLVRDVQVPTNLGDKVETTGTALSAEFTAVTALGDAGADWNIFFVWSLSVTGVNATEVDGATVTSGRDTLYEDDGGTDVGESMAHEAGHKFGIGGPTQTGFRQGDYRDADRINELMYYATDVRGCFIRKGQADIANP